MGTTIQSPKAKLVVQVTKVFAKVERILDLLIEQLEREKEDAR